MSPAAPRTPRSPQGAAKLDQVEPHQARPRADFQWARRWGVVVVAQKTRYLPELSVAEDDERSPKCLPSMNGWKRNALVLILGLWFSWPAADVRALDPNRELSQYTCVPWTLQNGLPPLKILAVAQTQDGYLWLGTDRGLVRFDGVEFTLVGAPPGSKSRQTSIQTLLPARHGGLWFGLKMSSYGFLGPGGDWWLAKDAPANSDLDVFCLLEEADGTLWSGGVHGSRWRHRGSSEEQLFPAQDGAWTVLSLFQDSTGGIWVGTNGRGLYYWKAGKLTHVAAPEMDSLHVRAVAEDRDGKLWFCTRGGLIVWDRDWHRVEVAQPDSRLTCLLADRHGVMWLGTTDQGLARCRNGAISLLPQSGWPAQRYCLSWRRTTRAAFGWVPSTD